MELHRGGEADRPVPDDPDAQPDLGVVHRRLHPAVADHHHLRADPLDPDLGVAAAEGQGPLQRGAADLLERQRGEGGIDGHARQYLGATRWARPGVSPVLPRLTPAGRN